MSRRDHGRSSSWTRGPEDEGKPRKAGAKPQAESEAAKGTVDHTEPAPDLPFGKPEPKKRGRK